MKSNLRNMVIVLTIITLVAAVAVGGIFVLTKEPIEMAKIAKTNKAIKTVMPQFDNDPANERFTRTIDGDTVSVYPARMGNDTVGYAIETFANGFGGRISLLVGFLKDGKIKAISVLSHKETPGLGDKIESNKSDFSLQFEGVDPSTINMSIKKDGGDVDAITASTITSKAYIVALKSACKIFQELTSSAISDTTYSVDSASGATTIKETDSDSGATNVEQDNGSQNSRGRKNKQKRGR